MILSGGTGPFSRAVQLGTGSRFSHVAVVTGHDEVTEAYDHAFTPHEWDDGVYHASVVELFERSRRTRRVRVIRPTGADPRIVARTARHLGSHSPGFPTLGIVFLALCGLTTPLLRRLPPRLRSRAIDAQLRLTADGTRFLQCAEAATRILDAAGVHLRFTTPVLAEHLRHVAGARADPRLHPLPTQPRRAERGQWPGHRGPERLPRLLRYTVVSLQEALMARVDTAKALGNGPVDWADLILPADLAGAAPFELVTEFVRTRRGWIELA